MVGELEALAASLPQTLWQLRTWIVDHSSELRYDATGEATAMVIDETVVGLEAARDHASLLADALRPAYDGASRLIGPSH